MNVPVDGRELPVHSTVSTSYETWCKGSANFVVYSVQLRWGERRGRGAGPVPRLLVTRCIASRWHAGALQLLAAGQSLAPKPRHPLH